MNCLNEEMKPTEMPFIQTKAREHKVEKTPRYTQRERNMVLGFAAQYKDIIENKRTDAESNRKKDEVWRNIAKEFNSRVYHQRTAKQLRQLYKNMKLLLKKDLSVDGRSKNFMDILNALSQQAALHPFVTNYHSHSQEYKRDYEDEQKPASSYSSENIESDIVIKSEDISDNEQESIRNETDDNDTISNKDIPEVCLEEDDDDDDGFLDDNPHKLLKNNTNEYNSLLSLAIEERKRKIDLLNAQIEYWKALTRKLESTNSSNCFDIGGSNNSSNNSSINHCHCHHLPSRINGLNQS